LSGRFLLDSHVFVWMAQDPALLQPAARRALTDAIEIFLSPVSVAELCIKSAIGKLPLPQAIQADPATGFRELAGAMGVVLLPLDLEPAAALLNLPRHHGDPFDRLIVAQALVNGLTLVTHDRSLAAYEGLDILWT
jgi:PIN domain nuclease of toxin-antitoxin system